MSTHAVENVYVYVIIERRSTQAGKNPNSNHKLLLSRSIGSCRCVTIDAEVEGGGKRSAHHECF